MKKNYEFRFSNLFKDMEFKVLQILQRSTMKKIMNSVSQITNSISTFPFLSSRFLYSLIYKKLYVPFQGSLDLTISKSNLFFKILSKYSKILNSYTYIPFVKAQNLKIQNQKDQQKKKKKIINSKKPRLNFYFNLHPFIPSFEYILPYHTRIVLLLLLVFTFVIVQISRFLWLEKPHHRRSRSVNIRTSSPT